MPHLIQQRGLGAWQVSKLRYVNGEFGRQGVRAPQAFSERAAIDELQLPGRLRRTLPPQQPVLGGRQEPRQAPARRCGVTFDFPREPGIERQDVRSRPHAPAAAELSRRVGEPRRVSSLARRYDYRAATADDFVEISLKPNQNKVLRYFRRFYLKRAVASTTLPLAGSRGALAYSVSNSSMRRNTSRSMAASGRVVTRK